MKTLDDLKNYQRAVHAPLTVGGRNVCELAAENPTAAYDLVFKEVEARGGFKAFHAHRARQSCIEAAQRTPLPGPAGDAFTTGAMTVNGRRVYQVVPTHFRCLQAVESPLLKLYEQAAGSGAAKKDFSESAEWEVCYIFTTPPRELRKLLESKGAVALKEAAEELVADKWTGAEINTTVLAAVAQIAEHHKTTVSFEAEAESCGTTFFQELRNQSLKQAESEKSSAT